MLENIRRKYILFNEKNKIYNAINNKQNEYELIYDELVSPLVYGEFLYFITIARFLIANNIKVKIIIITGEYRHDFKPLIKTPNVQSFLRDRINLIKMLLPIDNFTVSFYTWDEYKIYKTISNKSYILFNELVNLRHPTYIFIFDLLNILLKKSTENIIDKTLLSIDSININTNTNKIKLPNDNFISIHVRYNPYWSNFRNLSELEFCELINSVKKKYHNKIIILISDKIGCDYYRVFAIKHNLNCIFSSDISTGFLDSIVLVLKSKFLIALRGGGISTVATLSNIAYLLIAPKMNESFYKKYKVATWSSENQLFYSENYFNIEYLNEFNLKARI